MTTSASNGTDKTPCRSGSRRYQSICCCIAISDGTRRCLHTYHCSRIMTNQSSVRDRRMQLSPSTEYERATTAAGVKMNGNCPHDATGARVSAKCSGQLCRTAGMDAAARRSFDNGRALQASTCKRRCAGEWRVLSVHSRIDTKSLINGIVLNRICA